MTSNLFYRNNNIKWNYNILTFNLYYIQCPINIDVGLSNNPCCPFVYNQHFAVRCCPSTS